MPNLGRSRRTLGHGRQPARRGDALRVQVEALKERVTGHEREAHEIGDRLTRERKDAAAATAELAEARGKVDKLSDRVMELERALMAQTTEAEVLGRRVHELEARMVEQSKIMSDRELELSRLNETLTAGRKTEIDLRAELANAASRSRAAAEGLVKEKALIETSSPSRRPSAPSCSRKSPR